MSIRFLAPVPETGVLRNRPNLFKSEEGRFSYAEEH